MNAFQPSTKYQEDCNYSNPSNYSPRLTKHSSAKNLVNKLTNTPYEFMVCLKCQEKITRRGQQYANYSEGDCDSNINEYSKALNYINSCHTIINQMMKQAKIDGDYMRMPDLPNFMDLFNVFANSKTTFADDSGKNRKTTHESRYNRQRHEERSRNNSNDSCNRGNCSRLSQSRQQSREEQVRQTTKGRFIELLPDVKHDSYNKPEHFSPGTTESEESDIELNIKKTNRIAMSLNKFKSKIKTTHEKVIYEEDSHEDDAVNVQKKENIIEQKIKNDNAKKKIPPVTPTERPKQIQNSPTAQRSKVFTNSIPPMISNAPINLENTKKIKQRSSSSVTPRERLKLTNNKKGAQEIAGNFSDTAIIAGNIVGQIKKTGSKTLCTPIDIQNNELSQQELDKYAKELLGSETPTPRSPRSKSPAVFRSNTPTDKTKVEQERNKKFQKPFPSPTMKSHASEQRRRCSQEKQSCSSNLNIHNTPQKISGTTNVNVQQQKIEQSQSSTQQQTKKYRKGYNIQIPIEQAVGKKQNSCRKLNVCSTSVGQNQSKVCNNYSFGGASSQCCTNDNNYARNRNDKTRSDKNKITVEVQEEDQRNEVPVENEYIEDESCSSPEQLNLLCDNIETLSMHSRSGSQDLGIAKVQYSVTEKPRDFFTTNRKCVRMRRKEYDIESDIKTDSDIEEDHFEKDGVSLSRKSSKTNEARAQMSEVLSRLGLFPSPQIPAETEQMINEAKSTRANDERNRPFREPRKINEEANEDIMKIDDNRIDNIYSTESLTHLRRTISEESSDIKSDDDIYNNSSSNHQKSYNFCMGNNRYQT